MFNPIYRKLFWKEFRMLWPLWVAVFVLCMFIDLGIFFTYDAVSTRNYYLFLTAGMLPVLYGLGCAGTQFAWELENGTFGRLRALPITSGKVVWAKLSWTIVTTILLASAILGTTYFWTGGVGLPQETARLFVNIYGLAVFEAIAWGAIFSMRSQNPMMATVQAGTINTLVFLFLTTIYVLITDMQMAREKLWPLYEAVWPYRLVLLFVLYGFVLYQGRHWFDYWRQHAGADQDEDRPDAKTRSSRNYLTGDRGFAALCQQHWRQNRKLWAFFLFLMVVLTVFLLWTPTFLFEEDWREIVAVVFFIGSVLVAVNVFGADQSDRGFLFFAHHGVNAWKIWWSRVLLSGFFFTVLWSLGLLMHWSVRRDWISQDPLHMTGHWVPLGPCVLMCGVFFSVLFRSRILAWVAAFGVILGCYVLVRFFIRFQVSTSLLLLLAFAFMAGSYWLVFNRIHQRTGRRVWIKQVTIFSFCLYLLVSMAIRQRVESVPNWSIEEHWIADYEQAWKTPESASLFEELESLARDGLHTERVEDENPPTWVTIFPNADENDTDEVSGDPKAPRAVQENFMTIIDEASLNKVLQLANSPKEPDWSQMVGWNNGVVQNISKGKEDFAKDLMHLRHRLFETAEYYSRKGEPEKSLDCLLATIRLSPPPTDMDTALIVFDLLPRWAAGPGITPRLLEVATRRLHLMTPSQDNLYRLFLAIYFEQQKTLDDMDLVEKHTGATTRTVFTMMPWEYARTKRLAKLANIHTDSAIRSWAGGFNAYLSRSMGNDYAYWYRNTLWDEYQRIDQRRNDFDWYRQETGPFGYLVYLYTTTNVYEWKERLWQVELFRRLALTSLAIRKYQLEHDGALPGSINDVAKGQENRVPLSIPYGPLFGFRREGFYEDQCLQPSLNIARGFPNYKKRPFVDHLEGTPCIVLDRETFLDAYDLFSDMLSEEEQNELASLSKQEHFNIPMVYPLPFGEKKHEKEE